LKKKEGESRIGLEEGHGGGRKIAAPIWGSFEKSLRDPSGGEEARLYTAWGLMR